MDEIPRTNAPHPFKMHPTFGNERCIYGLSKDHGGVSCGLPLDDPIHTGRRPAAQTDPSDWGWAGTINHGPSSPVMTAEQQAGREIRTDGVMSPLEAMAELRAAINRGRGHGLFGLEEVELLDLIERELRR